MSQVRRHFKLIIPSLNYEVLYAEMKNRKLTKTYILGQRIQSELITVNEYTTALTYAILRDAKPPDTTTN